MFLILSILHPMTLLRTTLSHIFGKTFLRWLQKHTVSRYQRNQSMMIEAATFSSSSFASTSKDHSTKELCLTDIYSRSASYFYSSERPQFNDKTSFFESRLVLE